MTERRVVITGLGVINALGTGREEYFQALLDGKIGIDRIKVFDPGEFPSQVAGEAPRPKMSDVVPKVYRKATKLMSRDIGLAVIAADGAIRDGRIKTKATNPEGGIDIDPVRSGVNIGAGLICCDLVELATAAQHAAEDGRFSLQKWGSEGMNMLTPLWLLKYLPNMLSCHISIIHDLQGPSNSITCAEVSGTLSIGEAYRKIVHNKADLMVAGGAESKVEAMGLLRQCLLGRACTKYNDRPKDACRPFDRDAGGMVIGEGAGIVILEELEHARQRGATLYAEITGFGASNNFSRDFVEPEASAKGVTIALQKALNEAKLSPGEIDLLVAHGIAIASNDRAEATAIREAFGEHTKTLSVLATKSRFGNCGAAGGAIDLITAVLALYERQVPSNVNCPNPPSEYGLNLADSNQAADINHAMTCSYTYGGQTAALTISRLS